MHITNTATELWSLKIIGQCFRKLVYSPNNQYMFWSNVKKVYIITLCTPHCVNCYNASSILRRSRDGTLFDCPCVRLFVNQILASFSLLWPAVTPFT